MNVLYQRKPTPEQVGQLLQQLAMLPCSYPHGGCTNSPSAPPRYNTNRTRVKLGQGGDCFGIACEALRGWRQFELGWAELRPARAPLQIGTNVAVVARSLGLWTIGPCRIVQLIDEQEPVRRFGFAYGTLPGHAAEGEERFLVEWHTPSDEVWFEILAYSRPRHPLLWASYPWFRTIQREFGRAGTQSLFRAVRQEIANRPATLPSAPA